MATILLVEDLERQRELYIEELEGEGHHVEAYANAHQALDRLKQGGIDLVISDINMPDMDGVEFLGKSLDEDNLIPFIIHTAYTTYQDNFMTWAADVYVIKNSDMKDLKAAINACLAEKV